MKLILCDLSVAVIEAWQKFMPPHVSIVRGNLLRQKADATISPANSFGWMDGGIDRAYREAFPGIETTVQAAIRLVSGGELPVGKALIVSTVDEQIPHLICAPTMRQPMDIANTNNVFNAFRAAIRCAQDSGISTLLCPGLGTGVGGMCPRKSARQMALAIGETGI